MLKSRARQLLLVMKHPPSMLRHKNVNMLQLHQIKHGPLVKHSTLTTSLNSLLFKRPAEKMKHSIKTHFWFHAHIMSLHIDTTEPSLDRLRFCLPTKHSRGRKLCLQACGQL